MPIAYRPRLPNPLSDYATDITLVATGLVTYKLS
jgi:hypothetical protein